MTEGGDKIIVKILEFSWRALLPVLQSWSRLANWKDRDNKECRKAGENAFSFPDFLPSLCWNFSWRTLLLVLESWSRLANWKDQNNKECRKAGEMHSCFLPYSAS